jgi:PAS domain S-box-containing protein
MLQFISSFIIGFSVAGMLFSLLNALARQRTDYMFHFALLSLLTALYASFSLARRGCIDLPPAILLTRLMDISSLFIFMLLPIMYRSLCDGKPGKLEYIIASFYLLSALCALLLPCGITWSRINSMVPINLGRLGMVYRPEGDLSPLVNVINGVDILVMAYCSRIAWIGLRSVPGRIILSAVLPLVAIVTKLYYTGNQQGWWHLPNIGEIGSIAFYMAIGFVVYHRVKTDTHAKLIMHSRLDAQTRELTTVNDQLKASNQQLATANMQLTAEIDTRSKTETALRLAESRYRVLFNNSFELVGLLDPAGMLLEVNQTALSLVGASGESVKGKPFWKCPWWSPNPSEMEKCRSNVLKAAGGSFTRFEAIHLTSAGDKRFVDFSITPVFDEAGKVVFLVAEGRDITDRKQNEEVQQKSAILHKLITENAADVIWTLSMNTGKFTYVSDSVYRLRGYTPAEVMTQTMEQAITPESFAKITEQLKTGITAAKPGDSNLIITTTEIDQPCKNGSIVATEAQTTAVINEATGEIEIIGVSRDITERRKAERQLRETNARLRDREQQLCAANQQLSASQQQLEAANQQLTVSLEDLIISEEKYRSFVEQSTDGILLVDEAGVIREWNTALATVTGYTRDEAVGKPWQDMIMNLALPERKTPEFKNRLNFLFDMMLKTGTPPESANTTEIRIVKKNGVEAILQQTMFAIPSSKGFRIGSINRDISEYKKAQKELSDRQQQIIQADKMASLGLMVSGVAHEINNPNNLIMLNADIIQKIWTDLLMIIEKTVQCDNDAVFGGLPAPRAIASVSTMLSGISGGSRRIATLVSNLKDFARLDDEASMQPVDIGTVFESARQILHYLIGKSTKHFSVSIEPDLPKVFGNSQKIEQVLINLIVNACQALPSPDRKVETRAHFDRSTSEVVIDIEDEGQGIPEEIRGKIMDPFFTTKADSGGTGLGLSVTYGLVKAMNGSISFTSRVGQGTCFSVRLKTSGGTPSSEKSSAAV